MAELKVQAFKALVWEYYRCHGRNMPWREPEADGSFDAYKIMVSEVMLQQTQVSRVTPKYQEFIARFGTVGGLARAPLGEVLQVWSGLGYNRRAKFLHEAAQQVVSEFQGSLPSSLNMLTKLPGIGPNTAAAILVYAHNQPLAFIETNIRTVYIHHFFNDRQVQTGIDDRQLSPLVEATLDHEHPREWYWAVMDYGAHLKATIGNQNHRSRHYAKQSTFQGSKRQIRGQVLRLLIARPHTQSMLETQVADKRLEIVLEDLLHEGLISHTDEHYCIL